MPIREAAPKVDPTLFGLLRQTIHFEQMTPRHWSIAFGSN
jgi:hypothetical protein